MIWQLKVEMNICSWSRGSRLVYYPHKGIIFCSMLDEHPLPLAFLCRTEQCPDLVIFDENIKCHFVRGYVYSAKNVPISTMLKCQVLFVLWVLMFVEEMRRWGRSTLASLCKSSVGHTSAHYSNPWSAQWEMFIKYKCFGIQWNIWRKPMFG